MDGVVAGLKVAMRIICDFDGTITRQDSTDLVLEALAAPQWRALQDDWIAGRMTAEACTREQIALIGGSDADLDAVLDTVELDPGFRAFVDWSEARGLPLRIVSDGVDYFIGRILERHGLERLTRAANRLAGKAGARRLEQPWRRDDCTNGTGVCKCAVARGHQEAGATPNVGATLIFVGDGRSDFCMADHADIVFAKGLLAERAKDQNRPFLPFDSFHDVRRGLEVLMGGAANGLNRTGHQSIYPGVS